jgi:hypothetical protein
MCTILRRLAGGASLQLCRVHDVQMKQRSMLTIGLGIAAIIFILLCTVACGGGGGDGSLAKGGINMVVVSGQARIQSGGGNILVVEGQEAVITTGDQIIADESGVKLLLADGSLLYLNPDTDLQVVTFSAEGTARLSQLKGRLEAEAASPLLTVGISTSVSDAFALKTMQFTAIPAVRDTTFRLWIDGDNAYLTVKAGEVNVTNDDRTATISAGSEVKAIPGGELIVSQTGATAGPTATATPTVNLVPTASPTGLTPPSPTATVTSTPTPEFLYSAPRLRGPADGSDFEGDETILLIWDTPTPLSEDEWYEVQLWREGEVPYRVVQWVKEGARKVEPIYYPGRYQWRILIVRGQEGHKEMDLSPPSQTWSFSWLRPSTPVPTAPTSPSVSRVPVSETPISGAPVDLTVYLRGTNNAQGFATFSGEHIDAGTIYAEGGTVYGDVAVQIGDTVYHFDKPKPAPGEPEQLPAPYRLEFKFSESLVSATEGKAGFNPQKAQFWVGELNCNSATPPDKPYEIEMTLYAGGEMRKHTAVSFLVPDNPFCDRGGEEPEEGGGGGKPPVRP